MEEREYWRERFCHIMALNEALFGQARDRLEELVVQTGICLDIDLDQPMTLCLTGLEKRFYAGRMGMSRRDFIALTKRLDKRLGEVFGSLGCLVEGKVIQYDQSKQLCYLVPADGLPLSAREIAGEIQRVVEELYGANPGFQEGGLHNVTALVERVACYEDLADAFETAKRLNRCGFFLMESRVFTQGDLEGLRRPCTTPQLMEHFDRLDWAVNHGDGAAIEMVAEEIFLTHLRWSFDFDLVKDVLSELRKKLLRYSGAFQLGLEPEVDTLFVKRYATIGELCGGALALLRICADATATRGRGVSPLVLEALYYMRNNFSRDIGLEAVAEHVGVSGGYLSRLFNCEVGESLPAYLTDIRMERAVTLIETSDLGVGEVGKAVGVANPQYFGALFKKRLGLTPQEYRRSNRARWRSEGE